MKLFRNFSLGPVLQNPFSGKKLKMKKYREILAFGCEDIKKMYTQFFVLEIEQVLSIN
jgi:hypothetical protein